MSTSSPSPPSSPPPSSLKPLSGMPPLSPTITSTSTPATPARSTLPQELPPTTPATPHRPSPASASGRVCGASAGTTTTTTTSAGGPASPPQVPPLPTHKRPRSLPLCAMIEDFVEYNADAARVSDVYPDPLEDDEAMDEQELEMLLRKAAPDSAVAVVAAVYIGRIDADQLPLSRFNVRQVVVGCLAAAAKVVDRKNSDAARLRLARAAAVGVDAVDQAEAVVVRFLPSPQGRAVHKEVYFGMEQHLESLLIG